MTLLSRKICGITLVALAVVALTGCAAMSSDPPETAEKLQKLKVAVTTTWTPEYSMFAVAEDQGYFAEEGIEVEWVQLDGGTTVATQLEQGMIDIGILAPDPVIIGHQAGGGLSQVYYYNHYRRGIFGVAVPEASSIQDAEDLAGARVGVANLASSGVPIAKAVAAEAGVDPESLVFVAVGIGAQATVALENGEVDALSLWDSVYASIEDAGIALRVLDRTVIEQLTSGGLAVLPDRIEQDPELFIGAARAVAKGTLFTETNIEAAIQTNWELFPESKPADLTDEEALRRQAIALSARMESTHVLHEGDRWGSFGEGQMQANVQLMLDSGLITEKVDGDSLVLDEYLDGINDWDEKAVIEDANNWS